MVEEVVKRIALAFAVLLAVVMLFPMALTVTNSLKDRYEHYATPAKVLPNVPTLEGYRALFEYPVGRWVLNTAVIIGLSTAIGTALTVAASFAFSRYRFRGRKVAFWFVMVSLLIPGQVMFIPSFLMVLKYGLYNSPWGVILPGAFSISIMWFMVRYMEGIPEDLFGMGRLDGLGALGLLLHVVIPMSAPVIAAYIAQRVVGGWVEYLAPLMVLRRQELYTLAIGIQEVVVMDMLGRKDEYMPNMSISFAGAVLVMFPAVAGFLSTQKFFVDGVFAKGGK
jgi:ABC-type glycerol-3-phosphate transport system permease component